MPSVYDPDAFQQRVKYAVECITKGRIHTRHFDTCFEQWDASAVGVAVYRRSLKNKKLAERIWQAINQKIVMENVERLKDVPTRELPAEAARERERNRLRSQAAASEERPDDGAGDNEAEAKSTGEESEDLPLAPPPLAEANGQQRLIS
jgi:hypothetical protein